MKPGIALGTAALVVLAFAAGWWIGHTTAADLEVAGRLAALEKKVDALAARPAARPAAARPERRGPDPDKVYEIDLGDAPVRGPEEAPVTIVEFSDFQCPFCRRVTPTLARIEKEYGDRVRVVWKHFPLPFHRDAMLAHKAAVAAGRQGKFWEMHDLIFENQKSLDLETLKAHAARLGLDVDRFVADLESPEVVRVIAADLEQGRKLGVSGTPGFFINGRFLSGAQPYEVFKQRIEQELRRAG